MRCDECQPRLLDYLYGLLEPAEAAAVEAHLAGCPACAAARAEAGRVRDLIATAARGEFPHVRFQPPVARPAPTYPAAARPASLSSPGSPSAARPPRRLAAALPWAVAAAIVLALPATILPILRWVSEARVAAAAAAAAAARSDAAANQLAALDRDLRQRCEAARQALAAARQTHDALVANWVREQQALARSESARPLAWDVLKPATLQPGAPNELLLVVHDRGRMPPGRLLAEIRDQTDAVLFSQPVDTERRHGREQPLRIPARVWHSLTPQSELFLVLAGVDEKTGAKTPLPEKVRLFGPVYTALLTTDRTTYRPGETVYVRSLTLDRVTFTPPEREQLLLFELLGPDGRLVPGGKVTGGTDLVRVQGEAVQPVLGPDGRPLRGVGTAAFVLPADSPEGEYTVRLQELPHPAGHVPALAHPVTRTLRVRSGPAEIYWKHVGFTAASYRPGEVVEAWAELRAQDRPLPGVPAEAVVAADDLVLRPQPLGPATTGPDGRVRFRFALPAGLGPADVRLKVTFHTATGPEVVADRVPVIGRQLVVEFFPEGGDLVGGLESRVYFRATTPAGRPVDLTGVITDGDRVLAEVRTRNDPDEPGANRGLGCFTFTPELGRPVWLKVHSPEGLYAPLLLPERTSLPAAAVAVAGAPAVAASRTGFRLPPVKPQGVVMTVRDPVTDPGRPVRVLLRSKGGERNLVVGAYTRGRLADSRRVRMTGAPGEVVEVHLLTGDDPRGGVVRITVFEEPAAEPGRPAPDWVPVAERLVYRRPGERLNLTYELKGGAGPDRPAELALTATDERGRPAPAVLYAAVVNAALAPAARDRSLTTHFLLAGEVASPDALEYADFLLSPHPRAAETLDLVLATQGWRRFAEQQPAGAPKRHGTATDPERARLAAANGQYIVWAERPVDRERRRLQETYLTRLEVAARAVEEARQRLAAVEADAAATAEVRQWAEEARRLHTEAQEAVERAAVARGPVEWLSRNRVYSAIAWAVLAVALGAVAVIRPTGRLPLALGSAGAVGLAVFLFVAGGIAGTILAAPLPVPVPPEATDVPDGVAAEPPAAPPRPLPPADPSSEKPETDRGLAVGSPVAPKPDVPPPEPQSIPPMPPKPVDSTSASGAALAVGSGVVRGGSPAASSPAAAGGSGVGAAPLAAPPAGPSAPMSARSLTSPGPMPPTPSQADADLAVGADKRHPLAAPHLVAPASPFGEASSFAGRAGAAGWQPAPVESRRLIPDELLASGAASAPVALAARPMQLTVAPLALEADAERLRQDVELARRHVQARTKALREVIRQALDRQSFPASEEAARERDGSARPGRPGAEHLLAAVPGVTPLVVREYAAPRPGTQDAPPTVGDTLLWQPVIVLPADGHARLSLPAGTVPGGYRVIVAGHTLDGRIGAVEGVGPVGFGR